MLAVRSMLPFTLGPEPLRCPVCERTRLACVQFYGHDPVHEEEIRARLADSFRATCNTLSPIDFSR
jgi:hypothetical protein